jgi:adenylate kinase
MLSTIGKELGCVLNIQVSDKKLIERLSGRRVCPSCGASYHVITLPSPKGNLCGVCGTALIQRADDSEETIKNRLVVYKKQTHPLIEYYKSKELLSDINGEQEIDKVLVDICNALGSDNK